MKDIPRSKSRSRVKAAAAAVIVAGVLFAGQSTNPLLIGFSLHPFAPYAGDSIQFRDTSVGDPDAWHWDFGDGSESTDRNPTHVYAEPGEYLIVFTISRGEQSAAMVCSAAVQ